MYYIIRTCIFTLLEKDTTIIKYICIALLPNLIHVKYVCIMTHTGIICKNKSQTVSFFFQYSKEFSPIHIYTSSWPPMFQFGTPKRYAFISHIYLSPKESIFSSEKKKKYWRAFFYFCMCLSIIAYLVLIFIGEMSYSKSFGLLFIFVLLTSPL